MERCLITLETLGIDLPLPEERPRVFLVTIGDEATVRPAAVKLLAEIRAAGIAADMSYRGRKLPQQLKQADDLGAAFTLILGEEEVQRGVTSLRDQATKEQREIALTDVITTLRPA